jgi:hypothetical protein
MVASSKLRIVSGVPRMGRPMGWPANAVSMKAS